MGISNYMRGGRTVQKGVLVIGSTEIRTKTISLTNAELLALRATPKSLVAAPGAGYVLELMGGILINDYTGAYTESTANLAVRYTNGSGAKASEDIEMTGFADATADKVIKVEAVKDVIMVPNAALVLHGIGAGEFGGGNAANVWRMRVEYRVHPTGL